MINWWCCEATSDSGDIGSGCYLSMLAISLRPGITFGFLDRQTYQGGTRGSRLCGGGS
jgi:hypothetical protein